MALNRRQLLTTSAAISATACLGPTSAAARILPSHTPVDLAWSGKQMLDAFIKARSSLSEEFTIGWVDASTCAVISGETIPLYRLLAATWQKHRRVSDSAFEGKNLEVAFYLDVNTGKRLEKLTMPRTDAEATVPNYRSGPSANKIVAEENLHDDFNMARETQGANNFFRTGTSYREQKLLQPQRDADDFLIRQMLGTRVMAQGSDKPVFFYHEWTVNRAPWRDIMNPRVMSTAVEVQYASIAAFRPWMQMQSVDGHTLQTGRGGKVWAAEQLPPQLLALCRQYHPDLIADAAAIFSAS
jgi:hypothetical protein